MSETEGLLLIISLLLAGVLYGTFQISLHVAELIEVIRGRR